MTEKIEKLRVGEYFRKSSVAEDKQAYSIPDQKKALEILEQKEGLNVVKRYPGESQSAHTPGRPIFADLVKDITNGTINAIAVWHANRLSRNPIDAGMIIWLMDIGKLKQVKTPTRTYENTASDKFFLYLELIISKKDSDDKSEVIIRALEGRARRGLPNGIAPIGYINNHTKEKGSRDWSQDLVRHPLVKELLLMMLSEKYSVRELHIYARDEMKLTTPIRKNSGGKPIFLSYMYTLLKDPIHAGFFFQKSSGKSVRYEFTPFEPMITEDQYWKIQDLLGRKGVPRITNRKATYHYFSTCGICNGKHSTDFKFQVICSACKKKFSHLNRKDCPSCKLPIDNMVKPTFLTYIFYYCLNNKQHRTNCPNSGIEEKNLEAQLISDMVDNLAISKELSAWCIDNIPKVKDEALENAMNVQRNLEQEKTTIEGRLKRLTMLRISRDYSGEENTKFDNLEKELQNGLSLIDLKLSNTNVDWLTEATKDFNLMSEIADILKNGTPDQKRDILFAFRSNLAICDKKVTVRHKQSIEAFKSCLLLAQAENGTFEPKSFNDLALKTSKNGAFDSVSTILFRD
ncbi:MAG: recombinase family protein [Candidatus Staskawiczbacteria bacterium]|nr:recombinase family protein [Candidatus Staskawiczbacteria bacterium]